MVTWDGAFGWQSYAVEGRPDILNYLLRGDATWSQVWELYRVTPAPPEAMLRISGLFHASLSADFSRAGCYLDPDGEICRQLEEWAGFAAERSEALGERAILEALVRLGDLDLISPLYFSAAHAAYMGALLDRLAAEWRRAPARQAPAPGPPAPAPGPPSARLLPPYCPDRERHPDLLGDAAWSEAARSFLAGRYHDWNAAYAALYARGEEDELFEEAGGEG